MPRVRRSVTLVNVQGLHARPISRIVETARRHRSSLAISSGCVRADGRNLLQMLTLAAPPGTVLELDCEGDDAEELVAALERLIAERFGEE